MANDENHVVTSDSFSDERPGADILGSRHSAGKKYRIKTYDFWRPDKFTREQMRTLSVMHEEFARHLSSTLSVLLQEACHWSIAAVDQLNFDEFLQMKPDDEVFALFNMQGKSKTALMSFPLHYTQALVDASTGTKTGKYTEQQSAPRSGLRDLSLSSLEEATFRSIMPHIFDSLSVVWSRLISFEAEALHIMGKKGDLRFLHPYDMIVLISFKVQFGSNEELVDFVLPYILLEDILDRLNPKYWYSNNSNDNSGARIHFVEEPGRLPLETTAYIPAGDLSLAALNALKIGDMIPLPALDEGDIYLEAGGEDLFHLLPDETLLNGDFATAAQIPFAIERIPGVCFDTGPAKGKMAEPDPVSILAERCTEGFARVEEELHALARRQRELLDTAWFSAAEGLHDEEKKGADVGGGPWPLAFIRDIKRELLLEVFEKERVPMIAQALSLMEPLVAGDILSRMDGEKQEEIFLCLSALGLPAPFTTEVFVGEFRRFQRNSALGAGAVGADQLIGLLSAFDRKTEKKMLTLLEKIQPELALQLSQRQGLDQADNPSI